MSEINKDYKNYPIFLGGDSMEAASDVLQQVQGKLRINTQQRVLLIGIGGAGINTVDYIVGMMNDRMESTWINHISYVIIDSDDDMLANLKYASNANNTVNITRMGVASRMEDIRKMPTAVRRSMLATNPLVANNWAGNGAGQRRLMGRVKLHDNEVGNPGVDEDIVNAIQKAWGGLETHAAPDGDSVYVIGSVCGGTCSGTIQEMPALIRKAIKGYVKIYTMLYTPDSMLSTLPTGVTHEHAKANAYAALKEINYYQGMKSRREKVAFPYNSNGTPEILIDDFFDEPMLIGNAQQATQNADLRAEQTVAEYLVNQFTFSTTAHTTKNEGLNKNTSLSSVLHNKQEGNFPMSPGTQIEASGEAHEFPRAYGAIGFAKAGAPYKVIRAYAVDCVCKVLGLHNEKDKNGLSPFVHEQFNAPQGTQYAETLIKPLEGILDVVCSAKFDMQEAFKIQEVEYGKILAGAYAGYENQLERKIADATQLSQMEALRENIAKKYKAFCENVKEFVKDYGPLAFSNIYYGNFIKDGENTGTGIQTMLAHLIRGNRIDGQTYSSYKTEENAQRQLDEVNEFIRNRGTGIIKGRNAEAKQLCAKWTRAYNDVAVARINDKRREMAIGDTKYLHTEIKERADRLAEQMEKFGHIIQSLSEIYDGLGKKSRNFDVFKEQKDSTCDLNLASLDERVYDWLIDQVDTWIAKDFNGKPVRDKLIEEFMKDPDAWLDDAEAIKNGTLKFSSKPIKARILFDRLMKDSMSTFTLNVSIQDIISYWKQDGKNDYSSIAKQIIGKLKTESTPLINGQIGNGTQVDLIMIPKKMRDSGGDGATIADKLIDESKRVGINLVYETDDSDAIIMYSCVTELPIYCQKSLKDWENEYLVQVGDRQRGLHGLSPIKKEMFIDDMPYYVDRIPWADYPAITVAEKDPRERDAQGKISHEGLCRKELDSVLEKAEKYGVISYHKDDITGTGKWICDLIHLDQSREWKFSPESCEPDQDGYLPVGRALMENILNENGVDAGNRSRFITKIELDNNATLMSGEYDSEDMARKYIPRILRSHVPMYLKILDSLDELEKERGEVSWLTEIEKYNENIRKGKLPDAFVRLMLAGKIKLDGKGIWRYYFEERSIILLNSKGIVVLEQKEKKLATNFLGFYLYSKVKKVVGSSVDFLKEKEKAEKIIEDMNNSGGLNQILENKEKVRDLLEAGYNILKENDADFDEYQYTIPFNNFICNYIKNDEQKDDIVQFYGKAHDCFIDE